MANEIFSNATYPDPVRKYYFNGSSDYAVAPVSKSPFRIERTDFNNSVIFHMPSGKKIEILKELIMSEGGSHIREIYIDAHRKEMELEEMKKRAMSKAAQYVPDDTGDMIAASAEEAIPVPKPVQKPWSRRR